MRRGRTLEALRELLYERPSAALWQQVLSVLDAETDPGMLAVAVDYASSVVEPWPLLLRVAPRSWWRARLRGERHAAWPLARTIDLSWGHRDEHAVAFLRSPSMEELVGLALCRSGLSGGDLRRSLVDARVAHLVALDLSGSPIQGGQDVRDIDQVGLASLRELRLRGCPLGADAFAQLGHPAALPSLKRLDLSGRRTTRGELLRLWGGGGPLALETLVLEDAGVDELVSEAFAAGGGPPRLQHLHLAGNALCGGGLWALAEGPLLARLVTLDLARNGLFWRDVRALADIATEGRLERLVLDENDLEDSGVECLAGWQGWSGARVVSLRGCRIGDEGAAALAEAPWLATLEELDLGDNPIGEVGKARLRERLDSRVRF